LCITRPAKHSILNPSIYTLGGSLSRDEILPDQAGYKLPTGRDACTNPWNKYRRRAVEGVLPTAMRVHLLKPGEWQK
jgi:hypothetical protein